MIVRSAHFIGSVRQEYQVEFNWHCDTVVLPLLGQLPAVVLAAIERPFSSDTYAIPIYQIFRLQFTDEKAMTYALESPARMEIHNAMAFILPKFEGKIIHYVSDMMMVTNAEV